MAIVIVNPNPVFDRTILLERLVPGTVMRTLDVDVTAGGKGINVARGLRALQIPSILVVPVGAEDHPRYDHLLADEGAAYRFFDVSGFVRIASIYRESGSDQVTVVNDAGYRLPEPEWNAFVDFAAEQVSAGDIVCIMGSLPAGLPADAARRLVSALRSRDAHVLVDTAPVWLTPALSAKPDVIAPNVHEAIAALDSEESSVFDDSRMSDEETRQVASDLAARSSALTGQVACVTAGSTGVAVGLGGRTEWIDAPQIEVVSSVGAGDSFVAGLAAAWHDDLAAKRPVDWVSAVGFGVACAAASCEVVRAGGVDRTRALELAASMGVSCAESVGAR